MIKATETLPATDSHDSKSNFYQQLSQQLRSNASKFQINSFQDPTISDGVLILDLIDAMVPNSVDRSQVRNSMSDEDKLENAKYAISLARKIGARVYALPEDIVEVKAKMVLTVFACLMAQDFSRFGKDDQILTDDSMNSIDVSAVDGELGNGEMQSPAAEEEQVAAEDNEISQDTAENPESIEPVDGDAAAAEQIDLEVSGKVSVSPTEDSGHGGTVASEEPSEADGSSITADDQTELEE